MKKFYSHIKSILALSLAGVMVAAPVFATELENAQARKDELEAQLEDTQAEGERLQDQADNLESGIWAIDAQVAEIQSMVSSYAYQASEIQAQVNELQAQIDAQQTLIDNKLWEISVKQSEIDLKQTEIDNKQVDIKNKEDSMAKKQEEMDEQYASMKIRIQYMYENLNNLYMEAFFSTETFGDAISKVQYLSELNTYNKEQMEKLQVLKDAIEADKTELEGEKAELEADRDALAEERSVLEAEEAQLEADQAVLAADRDYVQNQLSYILELQYEQEAQMASANSTLESMYNELYATNAAIAENQATSADIQAELSSAIADIAALTTAYESSVSEGTVVTYTGGTLCWPLPSVYGTDHISSWYGYRTHPVTGVENSFHGGVDIWCPEGTAIYAAASGVVVANEYNWSAGNWTVIYHGNGLYTEYMHQSYLGSVYVGQEVSAGEWIGSVGMTGTATGPHLHFGVALCYNGYFDGSCRVDPCPYLGIY